MAIENRELAPGTKLVARYKGQVYTAEVVQTDEGVRYRLEDGKDYKSPSSAGSAVMGGNATNGWRFWSLQGEQKVVNIADHLSDDPADKPKRRGKQEEPKVACGDCELEFSDGAEATEHMAKEHPVEEPPAE